MRQGERHPLLPEVPPVSLGANISPLHFSNNRLIHLLLHCGARYPLQSVLTGKTCGDQARQPLAASPSMSFLQIPYLNCCNVLKHCGFSDVT